MSALAQETRPFTTLDEALPQLETAVSPLTGIVTGAVSSTYSTDETPLPQFACELASARRTLGNPTVSVGSGAHPDPRRAKAAAIGEAIERYSAAFVPRERLVRGSARELGERVVGPTRFTLFHPSQFEMPRFPLVPFTDDTCTTFVEGLDLSDGTPALLPAELVYLSRPEPVLPPIGYSTSNGLACGPTFAEATLASLLELVERDAVMLAWKCRLSLPLLDWAGDEALMALDRRFFARTGLRPDVIDGSVFFEVPTVISVVRGHRGSGAALSVGAASAATVEDAWLKAIAESFGVYRWLRQQAASGAPRPVDPDAIESFDDHMLFYATDEQAALASFLVASPRRRATAQIPRLEGATPREQVAALVTRLAGRGISAYVVDVTSPDVRELGLHVVRVISPELCPLDVSHRARFLGGTRLLDAAYEAGLLPGRLEVSDLNPLPHPFP